MATSSAGKAAWPSVAARIVMRPWLSFSERGRRRALEAAFDSLLAAATKDTAKNFPASATLLNIGLFLLLAERDIQCLKIDALTHADEWHRKLCLRVIILTIHEWDFDKVGGRALKDALESAEIATDVRKEAVAALRDLRAVEGKVRKTFGSLRNSTIAHRDADALAQYQAIRDIDETKVFEIVGEFYAGVSSFTNVLIRLMAGSITQRSLLHQWLRTDQAQKYLGSN